MWNSRHPNLDRRVRRSLLAIAVLTLASSCSVKITSLKAALSNTVSRFSIGAVLEFYPDAYQNTTTYQFTVSTCSEVQSIAIRENNIVPNPADADWQNCTTVPGALAHTLLQTTQGLHPLYAFVKKTDGTIEGGDSPLFAVYDTIAPVFVSSSLNAGAALTGTPLVSLQANISDPYTVESIRVKAAHYVTGDCQSEYANDGWQSYSGASGSYTALVAAGDGTKKVCAWARDRAGNISTISPTTGIVGTNADTIELQIGNPPQVTSLTVANDLAGPNFGTRVYAAGNPVRVAWTVTDIEGLDNNPVSLYYTTDGSDWDPIIQNVGGLAGNPTSYSGSYSSFPAPAGFFRIKLIAKDAAGNTSMVALSDVQNQPAWSVYAGSTARTDDSGTLTARLMGTGGSSPFAIHPLTNDVYALDDGVGIKKLNARTGIVSVFIREGVSNLPANGALPADPQLPVFAGYGLRFDSKNRLYFMTRDAPSSGAHLYQFDLENNTVRRYLGGGTSIDPTTSTAATIYLHNSPYAFDEDSSLYFATSCTPGTWTSGTSTLKLLKLTQNADGSPGTLSHVAGNCVWGAPASGLAAATQPFTNGLYEIHGSISVWNRGDSILYQYYSTAATKILNGISYPANIGSPQSFSYHPGNQKLYLSGASLIECSVDLTGPNGDLCSEIVSATGSGDCTADEVEDQNACVRSYNEPKFSAQGTIFFTDGPAVNADTYYRIRYVDAAGELRTLMGSRAFYGDGLDRRFAQGRFGGIHYKQAADATVFGAGLYFVEPDGVVFGKIDPTTGVTSILFGDQSSRPTTYTTGTAISKTLSMGAPYFGGDGQMLTFDSNGLPWFRNNRRLNSVDASGNIVVRQTGSATWSEAVDGANPAGVRSYVYGPAKGITLKGSGVFFVGTNCDNPATCSETYKHPVIAYHDYASPTGVKRLMGDQPRAYSPPNAAPGSARNLPIDCGYMNSCVPWYSSTEDRLYFSEDTRIRYLTTPTDPTSSTLGTLLTAGGSVRSFIFSADGTKIFYVRGATGQLHCKVLSGPAVAWCDESALGPPTGMLPLETVPNQFTWKDATHLLMSNGQGEIIEYTLPP